MTLQVFQDPWQQPCQSPDKVSNPHTPRTKASPYTNLLPCHFFLTRIYKPRENAIARVLPLSQTNKHRALCDWQPPRLLNQCSRIFRQSAYARKAGHKYLTIESRRFFVYDTMGKQDQVKSTPRRAGRRWRRERQKAQVTPIGNTPTVVDSNNALHWSNCLLSRKIYMKKNCTAMHGWPSAWKAFNGEQSK